MHQFTALLLASVVALSACASPGASVPAETARGRIVIGVQNLPPTLDPHAFAALSPRRFGIYDALVSQNGAGEIEPGLAESWNMIDATTWRFRLAAGHAFQDRTLVDASAVKTSLDRALDPALHFPVAARATTISDVRVVDDLTLDVLTSGPDPLLPKRLAQIAIILPKLAATEGDWSAAAVGTGPYRVKKWVPGGELALEAVPEHPARPHFANVVIKQINDNAQRVAALQKGEVDLITNVPLDSADALKTAGFGLTVTNFGASAGMLINTSTGATKNVKVRQALNYAVDKDALVKTIYRGFATPDQGQVTQPQTFGFNPTVHAYPYDPAKAKQLLAEAGYSTGLNLKLDLFVNGPEVRDVAFAVQEQLKAIGITLDIQVIPDQTGFLDRLAGRKPRADLMSLTLLDSPLMDADVTLSWFSGSLPEEARRYANPDFDAVYQPSATEMDTMRRRDLLQQAAVILHDDPPYLFLVQPAWIWAGAKGITGMQPRADLEPRPEVLQRSGEG